MSQDKEKSGQLCVVCADVALCINYGCKTCSSCKAFFRRYVFKREKLNCYNGRSCELDKFSRTDCKGCRMDKCLAVGMKKQLILVRKNNESFKYTQMKNKLKTKHIQPAEPETAVPLHTPPDRPKTPSIYIMYNNQSTELKTFELCRLNEVQHALSVFENENTIKVIDAPENVHVVMNLTEVYVKKIITFCKKLTPFLHLSQVDQVVLLKSIVPESLFVRAAFLYQPEKDGWNWLADETDERAYFIPGNLFKTPEFEQYKFPDNRSIILAMNQIMEEDMTIQNIISALLLFKLRPGVSCPEYVKYQHILYCYLLRRYLEHKHKKVNVAAKKYFDILRLLREMDCFNETMARIHNSIQSKTGSLSEVLVEIYDLGAKSNSTERD